MLGKMLKYMRAKKGFRQEELAKHLNITQPTLSGYETDATHPQFEMIEQIAHECGFEIVFRDIRDSELITTKTIERKDIPALE